jgi:hypothetical protein
MHYKLLGFSDTDSVRRFVFERTGHGTVTAVFAVMADLALARKFHIALQELPSLCSRLLESAPDDQPTGTVFLTEAVLALQAAANRAAAEEVQAKRALRSRRGALKEAAGTDNNDSTQAFAPAIPREVRS